MRTGGKASKKMSVERSRWGTPLLFFAFIMNTPAPRQGEKNFAPPRQKYILSLRCGGKNGPTSVWCIWTVRASGLGWAGLVPFLLFLHFLLLLRPRQFLSSPHLPRTLFPRPSPSSSPPLIDTLFPSPLPLYFPLFPLFLPSRLHFFLLSPRIYSFSLLAPSFTPSHLLFYIILFLILPLLFFSSCRRFLSLLPLILFYSLLLVHLFL